MKAPRFSVSGMVVWFLRFSASALAVSGTAQAQVSSYIVIQPVAVCATDGTNCATFGASCPLPDAKGNQACTFFSNPDAATTSTPLGFVDSNTNRNLTRQTWLQAGIDVTFLPIKRYNNSNYQSLTVTCGKSGCDSTGSPSFQMLSQGNPSFPTNAVGCTTACSDPAAAANTANAIYMFFVNSLSPGTSGTPSPLYGFGWLNASGVAVASNSFSQLRFDTMAHEIGHNCNLDHTVYGAGQFSSTYGGILGTGPQNLMTSGAYRITPATTPEAILDVTPPLVANVHPTYKDADYLTLTSDQTTRTLKTSEQTECLTSGFINPSYDSSAIAGGGLQTAAATTSTASSSSSGAITFTVDFPPLNTSNGRNGRANAFIANLVLTPPGNFNIVSNSFSILPTSSSVFNTGNVTAALLHGNNGAGNLNCAKPLISGPSQECLVVTIAPDIFTANNNLHLDFSITIDNGSTPISLGQLEGTEFTWLFETDQIDSSGNTTVAEQFATTSVFGPPVNNQSAVNSGFPDPTNAALILNPDTFVGFTDISCVPNASGKCPKPTGGNWAGSGFSEP